MNTPETPKADAGKAEERGTDWTNFEDFKKNFASLAERIGADLKQEKNDAPSRCREENKLNKNTHERGVWVAVKTLSWFYRNLGGIAVPGILYGTERKDSKKIESDIYLEIANLWGRRRDQPPLALEFSKQKELTGMEEDFKKRKIEFDTAKKELEDIAAKSKIMRGKKKQRFESGVYEPAKRKFHNLEESFKYQQERLRQMFKEREVELGFREGVNRFLPLLDGSEYFEVQLEALDHARAVIGLGNREQAKKFKTAFEEALLRWAEKYIQDDAVIPRAAAAPKEERKFKKELSSGAKKLFTELERILPVVEKNPTPASIAQAQVIYRVLSRLIK